MKWRAKARSSKQLKLRLLINRTLHTLRLAFLGATFTTLVVVTSPYATANDTRTEKKAELRDLQGRLDSLKKDLAKNEGARSEAADQLRETESSISSANRRLRDLGEKRTELKQELGRLESQSQKLGRQIETQQQQISSLLYRQYRRGENDALRLLIGGQDPNQAARDYYFLTLLSQAKTDLVNALNASLAEKRQLADSVRDRHEQLAENARKQEEQRQALLNQQKQRLAMLDKIADKIKSQRREIDTLKRDEKRLSQLIDGLSRLMAKASKRRNTPNSQKNTSNKTNPEPNQPSLKNEQEPELGYSGGGAFAALRGKLRLPLRGEITHRYGSTRAEGGTTWKGLFIRANEGSEVKSIAPGQVVFSDWLRGFGNLLIVDHGDGYLTIYGNNQSLFRQAGDKVKAGEAIASVGNSGGNPESGLYFELRHQGQPQDPLKWVSLR